MKKDVVASFFSEDERFLVMRKNKKMGVISNEGKVIVPIEYDCIKDLYYDDDGKITTYVVAEKDGKVDIWLISSDINQPVSLVKPQLKVVCDSYDYIDDLSYGFLVIKCGNKYGAVDKNLDMILPTVYDRLDYYLYCGFKAKLHGKWGFINESGKTIIPIRFDEVVVEFIDEYKVKFNGKWGLYDEQGKLIVPIKYDDIVHNTSCGFNVQLRGKWGFVDCFNGKLIALPDYDEIVEYDCWKTIIAKRDGVFYMVTPKLEIPL